MLKSPRNTEKSSKEFLQDTQALADEREGGVGEPTVCTLLGGVFTLTILAGCGVSQSKVVWEDEKVRGSLLG